MGGLKWAATQQSHSSSLASHAATKAATSNEKWGPTGTQLHELAAMTHDQAASVFEVLQQRLQAPSSRWRKIYKALNVLEYLAKRGAPCCPQLCQEQLPFIHALNQFMHTSHDGTDSGINVRKRATALASLLQDVDGLEAERAYFAQRETEKRQAEASGNRSLTSSPHCITGAISPQSAATCKVPLDFEQQRELCLAMARVLTLPGNTHCADCADGTVPPVWASTSCGVLLCMRCAGVHRSLGVHVSKVRSVTSDKWTPDLVAAMEHAGGNAAANARFEATLPTSFTRPTADSSAMQRFIFNKYALRRWFEQPATPMITTTAFDVDTADEAGRPECCGGVAAGKEGVVVYEGVLLGEVMAVAAGMQKGGAEHFTGLLTGARHRQRTGSCGVSSATAAAHSSDTALPPKLASSAAAAVLCHAQAGSATSAVLQSTTLQSPTHPASPCKAPASLERSTPPPSSASCTPTPTTMDLLGPALESERADKERGSRQDGNLSATQFDAVQSRCPSPTPPPPSHTQHTPPMKPGLWTPRPPFFVSTNPLPAPTPLLLPSHPEPPANPYLPQPLLLLPQSLDTPYPGQYARQTTTAAQAHVASPTPQLQESPTLIAALEELAIVTAKGRSHSSTSAGEGRAATALSLRSQWPAAASFS